MSVFKNSILARFKWRILLVGIVLAVVILLTLFTDAFETVKMDSMLHLFWLFCACALLIALVTMISGVFRIINVIQQNGKKLEEVTETLKKNQSALSQINQNIRLSETAKTIVFRDADRQSLRQAVFEKLQQQDFETTHEIIDEIAHSTIYQELAKQLRQEANKYQQATTKERINQVIAHVEKLLEARQWIKASVLIERLIKAEPDSEQAKAMRQQLIDKKQECKNILLSRWDDAVKRQATEESLQILRELDLYLTPNEGLALQEAARDVFRTKLHSLGVVFSLAVSGRQWNQALKTGRQIVRDFPNSRMAGEIRDRMDILEQNVQ